MQYLDSIAERALIPAALAVLLALLLVPQGRLTWAPLENAANALRNAFEDYFHFSEVRQTFSLQERGYNYTISGEDGEPEPRLGGPADPDDTPVMRVRVVCGLLDVIAIFCPISRFIRVDFPTFGLPISVAKPDLKLSFIQNTSVNSMSLLL